MLLRRESKVVGLVGLAGLAVMTTAATLTLLPAAQSGPATAGSGRAETKAPSAGSSPPEWQVPGRQGGHAADGGTVDRPNVLLITADDAAVGDMAYLPQTRRLIAEEGTTFDDAIAPTPICAPSRASLLTGQYAHNHGVLTVEGAGGGVQAFHDQNTLPVWLQRAGYDTLFLGKYLNGYGDDGDPVVPPGWDEWRATVGSSTYDYLNPTLTIDGHLSPRHEYTTDLIADQSSMLLNSEARKRSPWFMWVNYLAPHHGEPDDADDQELLAEGVLTPYVAPRYRGTMEHVPLPDTPDMFRGNAPGTHWAGTSLTARQRAAVRSGFRQRLESLQSVDDAVARTIATLRRNHQLDDTIVIFASDNGFMTGQHNIYGKLLHYDESLRIPVTMRGPGIPKGEVVETAITTPDLATTIAAIAGARPGRPQDGIDIRPLIQTGPWLRPIPIEAYPVLGGTSPLYTGIRYGQYTYIRMPRGAEELFDRGTDPFELTNAAGRPAYARTLATLRAWDRRFHDCAGDTCPKALAPGVA
ncbi:MAG TPA: sulfatase [Nocardioides sp.]|uniref:sulfatase family protein n=1 Tax=Nocardioides sp. TaxID=35761 RepID=UPI002E353298|nr:sulfatase [Nocardioides sp.]HEX5087317.1 sulfatase [Nocardioides sp.]